MLRVVIDDESRAEMRMGLDEIVLDGARRMLAAALEAEVDAYIAGLTGERDGSDSFARHPFRFSGIPKARS